MLPPISVDQRYYAHERPELVALIEPGARNIVLDVGCGVGGTSAAVRKAGLAAEIWGLELVPEVAEQARASGALDKVLCGDVEQLVDELPKGYFTHVIAGDVLEHLVDPWTVVAELRACMTAPGTFVSGIPNIRNLPFIFKLLTRGTFEYQDSGVLDRTRLRFFARKDIDRMFRDAGYTDIVITEVPKKRSLLKRAGRRLMGDLVVRRLLVRACNSQGGT